MYLTPAKEPILFAVGGRGHYENPTSDLLAFFLKPDAEHGLKDLFLSTFLECIAKDYNKFHLHHVDIKREVRTDKNNRIDLQIVGSDWCLLIENKIYHWQANPFEDYEEHSKKIGKPALFSILSPDRNSEKAGWSGVSYKNYCQALRKKMATILFDAPFSKWHIFAREFILHMENELYNPPMKPEQAKFVEKHAAEFFQAHELLEQYPKYLCSLVKKELEKNHYYKDKVEFEVSTWGILIKSPERWGKAYFAFRTPTDKITDPGDRTANFDLCIYPDEGKLKRGESDADQSDLLKGMRYDPKGVWMTENGFGFDDSNMAIESLVSRTKLIERPVAC